MEETRGKIIQADILPKRETVDHKIFEHRRKRLRFKDDTGKERTEDYLFTRGAIAWPKKGIPGIIIMAGQQMDKIVIIFEETEFSTVHRASEILYDLWERFLPDRYYVRGSHCAVTDHEFISELVRRMEREKIPIAAPDIDIDHGTQLINTYLYQGKLITPKNGILAKQLEQKRDDLDKLHAIEALRYLLVGILQDPPHPIEVNQATILPKDVTEVAELEQNQIWRHINEEDEDEDEFYYW